MIIKKFMNYSDGIRFVKTRFCCSSSKNMLKRECRRYLEIGMVISLVFMILVFQAWKIVDVQTDVKESVDLAIQVEEIPQTIQQKTVPPPARPVVPIATEDETIPEDETIMITDIDFEEIPPPPVQPEQVNNTSPVFVAFEEPPQPVGGTSAIQANLEYPEVARRAGIEGMVVLYVFIDERGRVGDIKVMKSLSLSTMHEAAIEAVKKVRWKPATNRDKAVAVWYSVPVNFSLKHHS